MNTSMYFGAYNAYRPSPNYHYLKTITLLLKETCSVTSIRKKRPSAYGKDKFGKKKEVLLLKDLGMSISYRGYF
ncbi:hypothetical protein [Neobacillus sp. 19]|uniref:hypothetical protein n=1 Tax=Neobacillus sp. 19 TaxID=3394458 RepID=UPI003C303A0F